jgi:hypothetical protein
VGEQAEHASASEDRGAVNTGAAADQRITFHAKAIFDCTGRLTNAEQLALGWCGNVKRLLPAVALAGAFRI